MDYIARSVFETRHIWIVVYRGTMIHTVITLKGYITLPAFKFRY